MEQNNLVKMRNSNLGQSAPSLSASLVRRPIILYLKKISATLVHNSADRRQHITTVVYLFIDMRAIYTYKNFFISAKDIQTKRF